MKTRVVPGSRSFLAHQRMPVLLALVAWAHPGLSQDAPLIDAVGAYHHANVMQPRTADSVGDDARKASRDHRKTGTISRRDFDTLKARIRLEYQQRLARDGRNDADAWLQKQVAELRGRYRRIED